MTRLRTVINPKSLADCFAAERFTAISPGRKKFYRRHPEDKLQIPTQMRQRNKYFQLRLTESELSAIRAKSAAYKSVSHYIRSAVAEYSNVGAKERLNRLIQLGEFYNKWSAELGHLGGNLNQYMKRANELAMAGLLSEACMARLSAVVNDTKATLNEIKRELYDVTQRGVKG